MHFEKKTFIKKIFLLTCQFCFQTQVNSLQALQQQQFDCRMGPRRTRVELRCLRMECGGPCVEATTRAMSTTQSTLEWCADNSLEAGQILFFLSIMPLSHIVGFLRLIIH